MTYHQVCNKINTTGATCLAETATLPEHPSSFPVFSPVRVYWIFSFLLSVLYIIVFQFFLSLWPLYWLTFELRLLITPLVSPNFSYMLNVFSNLDTNKKTSIYEYLGLKINNIVYIPYRCWIKSLNLFLEVEVSYTLSRGV
jgi:hypothetical protein